MLQFVLADLFDAVVYGGIGAAVYERRGVLSGVIGGRAEEILAGLDTPSAACLRAVRPARHAGRGFPRHPPAGHVRRAQRGDAGCRRTVGRRSPAGGRPRPADPRATRRDRPRGTPRRLAAVAIVDRRGSSLAPAVAAPGRGGAELGRVGRLAERAVPRSRLEAAIEALPERAATLNDTEVAFITAGQAHRDLILDRERRTSRRLRRLLAGASVALVVALVAGTVALVQRQRAADARTTAQLQRVASQSVSLRSTQRDVAVLLAVEAYRRTPTAESRSALLATLQGSPGFLGATWLPITGVSAIGAASCRGVERWWPCSTTSACTRSTRTRARSVRRGISSTMETPSTTAPRRISSRPPTGGCSSTCVHPTPTTRRSPCSTRRPISS